MWTKEMGKWFLLDVSGMKAKSVGEKEKGRKDDWEQNRNWWQGKDGRILHLSEIFENQEVKI